MSSIVLIADGSPASRILTSAFLKRLGIHQIFEAEEGAEALRILMAQHQDQNPVSVLVIDRNLIDGDGISFVGSVRRLDAFKNLFVIVTSEDLNEDSWAEAVKKGANRHLLRPINEERVRTAFAGHLP